MEQDIKVGDRILVKDFWGGMYHANVIGIGRDLLGKYYIGRYGVISDFSGRYEKAGKFRNRHIVMVN